MPEGGEGVGVNVTSSSYPELREVRCIHISIDSAVSIHTHPDKCVVKYYGLREVRCIDR